MDAYTTLETLVELAQQLGMTIRRASGMAETDHPGGALVRIRDQHVVFLDPTAAPADQADVLVRALTGRPELEHMYLPPEIRDLLEGPLTQRNEYP